MRHRVLLAWEAGGGGGHSGKLIRLATALYARDVLVDFADPRPHEVKLPPSLFEHVFQAPRLPAMRRGATGSMRETIPARSYAGILRNLGFDDPNMVARQMLTWRALLDAARPDLVVADHAPGLVLAARGRLPLVMIGTSFCVPVADGAEFPPFAPDRPSDPAHELAVLAGVGGALAAFGEAVPDDLPSAVVPADRFALGFTELDPYARLRPTGLLPPLIESCRAEAGGGAEVAVFLPAALKNDPVVVAALLGLGRPVRLDAGGLESEPHGFYQACGLHIDPQIIDTDRLAQSAALLLNHGGFHSVARGLIAGVPQVIITADSEKRFNAEALERLGVGVGIDRTNLTVPALCDIIERVAADPAFAERARALAPSFRERLGSVRTLDVIADRIVALLPA